MYMRWMGANGALRRRTGVTLKDTGIRDEYGLEPIEGIFSSPEKSPAKGNGTAKNSTINTEEDMDIGNSIHLGSLCDVAHCDAY